MNTKQLIKPIKLIMLLSLLAMLVLSVACASPPEEVQRADIKDSVNTGEEPATTLTGEADATKAISAEKSMFTFTGYGPGKSHEGTFTNMEGALSYDAEGNIVAAQGIIYADSASTGIGGLDGHLKKEDFFDVANHPTITMQSTSMQQQGETITVTGDITLLGETKSMTFDAVQEGEALVADFVFDAKAYGIKNSVIDNEVRVQFRLMPE